MPKKNAVFVVHVAFEEVEGEGEGVKLATEGRVLSESSESSGLLSLSKMGELLKDGWLVKSVHPAAGGQQIGWLVVLEKL